MLGVPAATACGGPTSSSGARTPEAWDDSHYVTVQVVSQVRGVMERFQAQIAQQIQQLAVQQQHHQVVHQMLLQQVLAQQQEQRALMQLQRPASATSEGDSGSSSASSAPAATLATSPTAAPNWPLPHLQANLPAQPLRSAPPQHQQPMLQLPPLIHNLPGIFCGVHPPPLAQSLQQPLKPGIQHRPPPQPPQHMPQKPPQDLPEEKLSPPPSEPPQTIAPLPEDTGGKEEESLTETLGSHSIPEMPAQDSGASCDDVAKSAEAPEATPEALEEEKAEDPSDQVSGKETEAEVIRTGKADEACDEETKEAKVAQEDAAGEWGLSWLRRAAQFQEKPAESASKKSASAAPSQAVRSWRGQRHNHGGSKSDEARGSTGHHLTWKPVIRATMGKSGPRSTDAASSKCKEAGTGRNAKKVLEWRPSAQRKSP